MQLDLTDASIFGNDAGEDEDPEILSSYFLEKASFKRFSDPTTRLAVARARKGMGKSALLAKVAHDQGRTGTPIVILVKGSDLTGLGEFAATDPSLLINQWQKVICARIVLELGKRLKLALTDDAMALVENAELAGFKERNIISAISDRLLQTIPLLDSERKRIVPADSHELLKRYAGSGEAPPVWLIVDDIDSTFIDTLPMRMKISSFFSACRKLISDIKGLVIRASLRTDVWTTVVRTDEALDKCEQYITDISWSTEEARRIVVNKIHSFVSRRFPGSAVARNFHPDEHAEAILRLVFENRIPWGRGLVPPDRPINILSAGRPRWSAQLCRLAGQEAARMHESHIGIGSIRGALKQFGRFRLDDIYREHGHQFQHLQDLIETFAGGPTRYQTIELQQLLTNNFMKKHIQKRGLPLLEGKPVNSPLELGRFLFKVGFISARDEKENDTLSFVRYEDRPELLRTAVNLDDNLVWEVHPSYRQTLRLRNEDAK